MNEYQITKQNYDQDIHVSRMEAYSWEPYLERFCEMLKGGSVLDLGCGNGRDISLFIERGIKVQGLDFSPKTIDRVKRRFPKVQFHLMDMLEISLNRDSFDGIWACTSLLNLKKMDFPRVLKKIHSILKPGGLLFISTKHGNGESLATDPTGQRWKALYNSQEFTGLLTAAGFSILSSEIITDKSVQVQQVEENKPDLLVVFATN